MNTDNIVIKSLYFKNVFQILDNTFKELKKAVIQYGSYILETSPAQKLLSMPNMTLPLEKLNLPGFIQINSILLAKTKTIAKQINLPSRDEIEKLADNVDQLSKNLESLEGEGQLKKVFSVAVPVTAEELKENDGLLGDIVLYNGEMYQIAMEYDHPDYIITELFDAITKPIYVLEIIKKKTLGDTGNDRFRVQKKYSVMEFEQLRKWLEF